MKTFLGYQYYSDYCNDHNGQVQFIDDDTFVRFDQMESILQNQDQIVCLKVSIKVSWGHLRLNIQGFPIDNYAVSYVGKYYVWVDQWPSRYRVPKYCNGQCVGMNSKSVRSIYNAAEITDPNEFRLEVKGI